MDDVRCWIYSHLGELFMKVPRRLEPPVDDHHHPATRDAIDALCQSLVTAKPDDVAAEHVRLFVNAAGGIAAPPYASWYLDGSLLGPSTALVAEAYSAQCLELAEEAGQPLDYLVTELDFLHFLCRHQKAAQATDDPAALAAARDAETRFLHAHFFRWVPRFARAIRHAASDPVFARLADVLDAFCAEHAYPSAPVRTLSGGPPRPARAAAKARTP
jgi:TorA maturation chaperone TorD